MWILLLMLSAGKLMGAELSVFGPGIWIQPGRCAVFSGTLLYDQGPEDGLEVIAALRATKLHESLIELDTADAVRCLAALALVFGEVRGVPPDSLADLPPRGVPAVVWVAWQDAAGRWMACNSASLVRNRGTDRPLLALPAIYSGGAFGTYLARDGSGAVVRRPIFCQAGALCALFDEENGAPLAIAVPSPAMDGCWEANSRLLPPPGTRLMVLVEPAAGMRRIDPAATADPRRFDFRHGGPALRVEIPRDRPRDADRTLQRALVAAAREQGVEVGPVFVPVD